MSRHKYYQFVQLLVFALVLLACEVDEEKRPPISIFSQKHSFLIGDNLFDIQMVNLIASEKHSNAIVPCASEESSVKGYCGLQYAEIKKKYENEEPTISVSALKIDLQGYELFREETLKSYEEMEHELCPMLSQTWVRISCTSLGQHSPLRGILRIRRITLLHPKHIAVLNNEWIAGSTKNEADLVRSLNLLEKKPQRVCGRDESGEPASLCVAALRLENDLLAVWLVGRESGIEELVRDSSAIKAFIKYGISETENYPALEKAIKSIK